MAQVYVYTFTREVEGLRDRRDFEWMKYLHGVLHGNNMDDVSWSSKYNIGFIERGGGSNIKLKVVTINNIIIGY